MQISFVRIWIEVALNSDPQSLLENDHEDDDDDGDAV